MQLGVSSGSSATGQAEKPPKRELSPKPRSHRLKTNAASSQAAISVWVLIEILLMVIFRQIIRITQADLCRDRRMPSRQQFLGIARFAVFGDGQLIFG